MIKNPDLDSFKKTSNTIAFVSLLCIVTFLPSTIARFGRLDDFSFFLYTREDIAGVVQSGWTYGRPVTSFIIGNSFGFVEQISDFSILRLLSLGLLISVIVMMNLYYSKEKGFSLLFTSVMALYFISLPGIWVFMTWAQGLPHFLALFFVAACVLCYTRPKLKWLYYIFSLLSMFTYQPFSLLIPIILFTKLLSSDPLSWKKDFSKITTWNMALLLLNFLIVKLQPSPNPRSAISSDFSGKTQWIITEWIPRVIYPWALNVSVPLVSVSLLGFVFISFKYMSKVGFQKYAALFFTSLLPSLPFILSNENWASSRAVLSSNIAIAVFIMNMAAALGYERFRKVRYKATLTLSVACLFLHSLFQGYQGLVLPQAMEWNSVSSQMNSQWVGVSEIKANVTPFEQTSSPIISYDEFGILNSSVGGALLGMLTMAKQDTSLSQKPVIIGPERVCQTSISYVDDVTKVLFLFPISGTKGCV